MLDPMKWDIFISHASEDKDKFVRPLAVMLKKKGVKVWYDEFTLKIGQSLREKIDEGIRDSRFGLIVLSENFIQKSWAQKELNGFFAKEIYQDKDIVIPLWLGLNKMQVFNFSPILADKFGLVVTTEEVSSAANSIFDLVKESLFSKENLKLILEKLYSSNSFDIENNIADITYRLKKLYLYESELDSINVPEEIIFSDDEVEIEKFYAPRIEPIQKKYNFPSGLWENGPWEDWELESIEDIISSWAHGLLSREECKEFLFELDGVDIQYIFFGIPNFAVEQTSMDINLDLDFSNIGSRNY